MIALHACHLVWELAGRRVPTDPARGEGPCALCGQVGPLHMRIGPNFTDYRKLLRVDGTRMCVACSWVLGGKPPSTLRMWSLVARTDRPAPPSQPGVYAQGPHLHLTNRRDLRWVAATLADPPSDGSPWLVSVAETGQKHTAPFTAVNYGAACWSVQLDGCDVTATPQLWRTVLAHTVALRAGGFTADAIETGAPSPGLLTETRLALWLRHAPALAPLLRTPLLHLATLMITKETLDDYLVAYPADY
jgi:hypothetical protein